MINKSQIERFDLLVFRIRELLTERVSFSPKAFDSMLFLMQTMLNEPELLSSDQYIALKSEIKSSTAEELLLLKHIKDHHNKQPTYSWLVCFDRVDLLNKLRLSPSMIDVCVKMLRKRGLWPGMNLPKEFKRSPAKR